MANLGAQGVDFNGEIILTSNGAGGFKFTDSNNSTLMSKATITNDISSLVGGLTSEEEQRDSDVSSLAGGLSTEGQERDSDVSSLAAGISGGNEELNSDISSLQVNQSNNTVITAKAALDEFETSKVITWTDDGGAAFTFDNAPSVVAVLRNATANAVIIPCMVSAASTTGCTVVFADGMPSDDYVLEIIASN